MFIFNMTVRSCLVAKFAQKKDVNAYSSNYTYISIPIYVKSKTQNNNEFYIRAIISYLPRVVLSGKWMAKWIR